MIFPIIWFIVLLGIGTTFFPTAERVTNTTCTFMYIDSQYPKTYGYVLTIKLGYDNSTIEVERYGDPASDNFLIDRTIKCYRIGSKITFEYPKVYDQYNVMIIQTVMFGVGIIFNLLIG